MTTGSLSADERKLAEIGYKQELNRGWSGFSNFTFSAVNYAPVVTIVLMAAVWIAWEAGAKHTFKGPVKTVDEPDTGTPEDPALIPA